MRSMADPEVEPILDQTVGLVYGAIFGPDISDVYLWQEMAIAAIDAQATP